MEDNQRISETMEKNPNLSREECLELLEKSESETPKQASSLSKEQVERIKKVRSATQISLKECIAALDKCNDNVEEAIEHLRTTRAALIAEKNVDKEVSQGAVFCKRKDPQAIEYATLLCQTDFVSNHENFQALCKSILEKEDNSMEINNAVATFGENIQVGTRGTFTGDRVFSYLYGGDSIGSTLALVDVSSTQEETSSNAVNVAKHIAAFSPENMDDLMNTEWLFGKYSTVKDCVQKNNMKVNRFVCLTIKRIIDSNLSR